VAHTDHLLRLHNSVSSVRVQQTKSGRRSNVARDAKRDIRCGWRCGRPPAPHRPIRISKADADRSCAFIVGNNRQPFRSAGYARERVRRQL